MASRLCAGGQKKRRRGGGAVKRSRGTVDRKKKRRRGSRMGVGVGICIIAGRVQRRSFVILHGKTRGQQLGRILETRRSGSGGVKLCRKSKNAVSSTGLREKGRISILKAFGT